MIVNKVNDLTDRNATIKMEQDEYRKKYKKLAAEYNKLKDELDRLKVEDKNKKDRIKQIRAYVEVLKKSSKINEFNEELFAMLVDKVVGSDSEIKIRMMQLEER